MQLKSKDVRLVPLAIACTPSDVLLTEKLHLDLLIAKARPTFTPACTGVERECRWSQARCFGFGECREQFPYPIEYSDIDGWCRSWRSGERRLIHQDDLIDIMGTKDAVTNPGCFFARTAFQTDQILVENILHQCAFS